MNSIDLRKNLIKLLSENFTHDGTKYLLRDIGVSTSCISHIRHKRYEIFSLEKLLDISDRLGIDVYDHLDKYLTKEFA